MFSNFSLDRLRDSIPQGGWKDPKVFLRVVLGGLLVLNVVAAGFAFHLFGRSAEELAAELDSTQASLLQKRAMLIRTRQISKKVDKARVEGDQFLGSYMTPRRTTFSTITAELQKTAESAGMNWREATIAPLEPIKGTEDLTLMTVTISFDGTYESLRKFLNLLDRSPRFLIIDTLQAAPQANAKGLTLTLKLNAFIRDDRGELL